MTVFKQNVIKSIQMVPYGNVASYGQIAAMAGHPRAARQVGWILNSLEDNTEGSKYNLPWWRIVNNQGRISIKGTKFHDANKMKQKLESEGIVVKDDLTFDIELYRFRPTIEQLQSLQINEDEIAHIFEKYNL